MLVESVMDCCLVRALFRWRFGIALLKENLLSDLTTGCLLDKEILLSGTMKLLVDKS